MTQEKQFLESQKNEDDTKAISRHKHNRTVGLETRVSHSPYVNNLLTFHPRNSGGGEQAIKVGSNHLWFAAERPTKFRIEMFKDASIWTYYVLQ